MKASFIQTSLLYCDTTYLIQVRSTVEEIVGKAVDEINMIIKVYSKHIQDESGLRMTSHSE